LSMVVLFGYFCCITDRFAGFISKSLNFHQQASFR
jgi:hypothetical protein